MTNIIGAERDERSPAGKRALKASPELVFTVTANFTAEPVGDVLRFWTSLLGLGRCRVEFSGYNQVFQELIAPASLLASAEPGANFLLLRLEDWARDQEETRKPETIRAAVQEFSSALSTFAGRAFRPTVLFLCPPSQRMAADVELVAVFESLELGLRDLVAGVPGVTILTSQDLAALYPVDVIDDPESDRQAHVPFTQDYWAAMGTLLARKARALFERPYKVVVVDADNTLWGGVVGEVGADHVHLKDQWRELQTFLLAQKNQGILLALASKNREADIADVFRRADMVLRPEDFVAWKINWEPKSRNIAALARELELGLDSFLFLDDNPVECADVAANCPEVTTLLVPSDPRQIPGFLRHLWAFDLDGTTAVDEKRTELYRQQSERNHYRSATASFRAFIEGLQLEVFLAAPVPAGYERAAQLTQRTNQFNNTGIRWTAISLASALESGTHRALIVRVKDRFGDYGDVGVAIFSVDDSCLTAETLAMSCRVLGKGAEHRVLAALGHEAQQLGLREVAIPFTKMDRNQPAKKFLKSTGARVRADGAFVLAAAVAAGVVFDPAGDLPPAEVDRDPSPPPVRSRPDYAAIAELNSVEKIQKAVAQQLRRARPRMPNEWVPPASLDEARLAAIWEEVLHVSPVGVTDAFLSLGGQSLQAAGVVSRIAAEFAVRIPLSVLLSNPTIEELLRLISSAPRLGDSRLPETGEVSFSAAQQRLWFLDQFIPNRAAYNIPLGERIRGPLDPVVLKAALSLVVGRHETLRSTYGAMDGSAHLKISAAPVFSLRRVSASSEEEASALANAEARQPFDLSEGPLLRCVLISLGAEDHLLVLNVHHIVSDGWSMGILLRDLTEAYASATETREPSWRPLPGSYFAHAAWQKAHAVDDLHGDLAYWLNELRGAPSLLELPTDKPRPSAMTYSGGCVAGHISVEARRTLETLAARETCTPFTVLLAAWQAVLHRYSQQEDIAVGTPVAGRDHPWVEEVVGCFVNTLAIRMSVSGEASFVEHLRSLCNKLRDGLSHQDLPFEVLVSELSLERDLSRTPIFQVMLVLQDTPFGDFAPAGLRATRVPLHNGGAKFDLVLEVTPQPDGYGLALEFNTSLFVPETAERIVRHFTRLLEHACASPETSLATLPMMEEEEIKHVLSSVNADRRTFGDGECLHNWFARRAALSPEAPALSFEGQVLTYDEINRRANQIAHYLIASGVGPDVLVGICIDRSPNLVIAILGVLKAGGAYLPIDLSYPADRLAFMLADAQAPVLLTETKLLESLPEHGGRTICLDEAEAILSTQPATNPVTPVTPEHMAYVIYTSGSTGQPKGCVITHRNVARLMHATEQWYGFNERDVWTLFHSSAFDFSVWEIWGALLYGGRLVVVPFLMTRSPEAFYELLATEQVTVLNQTPSAFRQLIQAEESVGQRDLALRYVIFGGEALEMQSLKPWFDGHGDQKPLLVNMYGITETTVHVTYRPLSKNDVRSASVIGVPIPDLQIYILDPRGQPVPVGVPGEMYVGGAGLARGYLRRPELTAQRFVPDNLTGQPGARLYRTGDLARFLPGRDIEYLGRIDHQVKIRGFRIELGEIESVLCQHPAIREAVVMVREDVPGSKRLVAYAVAPKPAPEVSALREHLKVKLPDYMTPAAFVLLDKLPLTSQGKIDRKALPVPEQQRPDLAERYVAPRTEVEQKLATLWARVLRVEQVGVHDNFFELGGDSILSIQIISLARREGLKLTPEALVRPPNDCGTGSGGRHSGGSRATHTGSGFWRACP